MDLSIDLLSTNSITNSVNLLSENEAFLAPLPVPVATVHVNLNVET